MYPIRKFIKATEILYKDLRHVLRRELYFHLVKPRTAILIMTYRCDSKCKTCLMWRRESETEIDSEINLNEWKFVIDKLSDIGIRTFEIFGGNVLLRKDLLLPVLEYLYEQGARVHIPTNQLGLDDDIAQAMVRYADTVYLSTDGVGKSQDEIRGVEGLSAVGGGAVERLLRLRGKNGSQKGDLRIVCNCTVSRFNADRLEEIADYAAKTGFDEIHFEYAGEFEKDQIEKSKISDITPEPHYIRQEESILASKTQAIEIKKSIDRIRKKFKKK